MLSAQHVLFHLVLISTLQGRYCYPVLHRRELRTESIKGKEGIWTQVYAYLGHEYTSRLNPTSKCSVLPCLHYLWDPESFYAWKSILLLSRPHPNRDQLPANWAGMLLQNQQSENPHLRLNIYLAIASSREVNAQRLMVTMISFPPGEATLASRWDDNDREGIWCWKWLEVTGSCPELCWGNEKYEDITHYLCNPNSTSISRRCWQCGTLPRSSLETSGPAHVWGSEETGSQKNYPVSAETHSWNLLRVHRLLLWKGCWAQESTLLTYSGIGWFPVKEVTFKIALS